MNLTDTHCHLYSDEFAADADAMIERAVTAQVTKFYLPAINSETHPAMLLLEERYPGKCIAMMGLHPCSVKEDYIKELKVVEEWLAKKWFPAIGEIGLDFYWDTAFTTQQYEAFRMQMEWAIQYKLPVVIHTRKAMTETIDLVKEYSAKGLKGIFHCFSGTYEEALSVIDLGFYIGIGGVLTYKNSGLDKVVEKIDLQHMVLETDAPYLTPVPFRGKRNESSYIKYVADKLAAIKNISVGEVAAVTTANAEKIFGM
jgi:TatD DNase family protein